MVPRYAASAVSRQGEVHERTWNKQSANYEQTERHIYEASYEYER